MQCTAAVGGAAKFSLLRQAVWKSLWGGAAGGGSGGGGSSSGEDAAGATADLAQLASAFGIDEEVLNDVCALVHMEVDVGE